MTLTAEERAVLEHLRDHGAETFTRLAYRNLLPSVDALSGDGLVVHLVALTDAGRAALEAPPCP